MAIAKVQFKSSATATPEIWMDTTQKTVAAGKLLSGETALKNDGTDVVGTIATVEHPNPTATINSSTGVVTASHTQTTGVVTGGTTTGTLELTTQAAKTVTPTESEQTAVAAGRYTTGAVKVGAISKTYVGSDIAQNDSDDLTASGATVIVPSGYYSAQASKAIGTGSITAPTITVDSATGEINASIRCNSGGYVALNTTRSSSKQLDVQGATTITPSTSSQVAVASGKYTTGDVVVEAMPSGTAGTPTATKGTVSNHSVIITPSVTNTTGYITGGTKNGTAVSVSASELVSGTLTISSSGTKDVTNYASASVAAGTEGTPTATKGTVANHSVTITPSVTNTAGYITGSTKTGTAVTVSVSELESGTKTITEGGEGIDVSGYSAVDVNIATVDVQPLSISLNGTYTAPSGSAYSPVTVNVQGGGGSAEKKQVNFIDYDGTILYSYTATEANALTALPANPGHAGLISQGWNWTLAQIKSQLTAHPDGPVWIGQMYITQSGASEIDVTIIAPDLHPYLGIAVNGTATIDWGDNTTPDTVTGTNDITLKFKGHEYAAAGDYTISISVVSGRFTFLNNSNNNTGVLSETAEFTRSGRYSKGITAVRLGENAYIGGYAFCYCRALANITIPDGVTSFNYEMFSGCNSLTSVTIPDGVTSISSAMFSSCYALASVAIPNSITSIENNAFQNCQSLVSITIPDSVTSIGNVVFGYCYALSSVAISDGLTKIGLNMFEYCCSLPSVAIPTGITSIESNAFQYCTFTSITIPDGVTSIGNNAFSYCRCLTGITIPNGVTSIGTNAFQYCQSLVSITIPDSVTSIGDNAFGYCRYLTSITIPNGVTSIGTKVFYNCYSLTSITIPDGVTSIGSNAFQYCYRIREMHFKPTTPPTVAATSAFSNAFATGATIYVPTGCLEAYTTATNYPSSSAYTYVEE